MYIRYRLWGLGYLELQDGSSRKTERAHSSNDSAVLIMMIEAKIDNARRHAKKPNGSRQW